MSSFDFMKLFGRQPKPRHKPTRSFRLRPIETLEDRITPAVTFDGTTTPGLLVVRLSAANDAAIISEMSNGDITVAGTDTHVLASSLSAGISAIDSGGGQANQSVTFDASKGVGVSLAAAGTITLTGIETFAVSSGTLKLAAGDSVSIADFSTGSATVNAANPLTITGQLKLANSTGTLSGGSLVVAGTNIFNDAGTGANARTFTVSGGTLAFTGSAPTVNTIYASNFSAGNNGGLTQTNNFTYTPANGEGPWTFLPTGGEAGAAAWAVGGGAQTSSPMLTNNLSTTSFAFASAGPVTLNFSSMFQWQDVNGSQAFDFGMVQISVDGGAYTYLPKSAFTSGAYDLQVASGGTSDDIPANLMGLDCFGGQSSSIAGADANGYLSSTANLGTFNSGDTLSVRFVAASDDTFSTANPNWTIGNVSISQIVQASGAFPNTNLAIPSSATLDLGTGSATFGSVTVSGGATLSLRNGAFVNANTLAGSGNITGSGGAVTLTTGATNASSTFTGAITDGAGTLGLIKSGTGVLALGGAAASAFSGGVTIQKGTLRLLASNTGLPSAATVTLGTGVAGGTLDLNGFNQTLGGLVDASGGVSRVVNTGSGTPTLTLSTSNSITVSAILGNVAQNSFAVTKAGFGTILLSGANTFTGPVTVSGGILKLGNSTALGTSVGSRTTVASGASLDVNGQTVDPTEILSITGTGFASVGAIENSSTVSGTITQLVVNGAANVGGVGTLVLTSSTSPAVASSLTSSTVGTAFSLTKLGSGQFLVNVASAPDLTRVNVNAGIYDAASAGAIGSSSTGSVVVGSGGTLQYDGTFAFPAGVTLSVAGAGQGGIGAINKINGDGTLSQTITFTSSAAIGSGTAGNKLTLAGSLVLPAVGNVSFVGAGNTDVLTAFGNGSGAGTTNGAIMNGTGTVTLLSNDTYDGVTTITNGTLVVAKAGGLGSTLAGTVVSGTGTLALAAGVTLTGEPLSLSGAGSAGNGGALSGLGGVTSYAGTITGSAIAGAQFGIGASAGTLSVSGTIDEQNSAVVFGGLGNTIVNSAITTTATPSTNNAVLQAGSGSVTLTAANTYVGPTLVTSGMLVAANASALGAASAGTTVSFGATLDIAGSLDLSSEPLTIFGSGIDGVGALEATGGDSTVGNVLLSGSAAIGVGTSSNFTIAGTLSMSPLASVTFTGAGNITVPAGFGNGLPSPAAQFTETWYPGLEGANNLINPNAIPGYLTQMPTNTTTLTSTLGPFSASQMIARAETSGNVAAVTAGFAASGNEFGAVWSGALTVGGTSSIPAGPVSFGTSSKDGSAIYVDANQDGVFEPNELVVDNENGTGPTTATGTVNLPAGTYAVYIGYIETSATGTMEARIAAGTTSSYSAMATIDPSSAAQAGVWSALANNVTLAGTGTVIFSGNNTYNGTTTIASGTLVVANSNALGLASAGTFIGSTGTLDLTGNIAVGAEKLTVLPSAASRNAIVNLAGDNSIAGNIVQPATASGFVGVSTNGSSSLTLSGNVTLSGDTLNVSGTGGVYFNGAMSSATTVSLTGGILGGSGTVGSVIDNGGIVNPGTPISPGTLTIGNVTLGPLGLSLDLANITSFDSVTATGPVNISGSTLALNVGTAHGEIYTILRVPGTSGGLTGTFMNLPATGSTLSVGSQTFRINYAGGDGNDIDLIAVSTAPLSLVGKPVLNGSISYVNNPLASNQHSMVESVVYSFSSNVALSASNFALTGINGTTIAPTVSVAPSRGNTAWTVTFSGAGVNLGTHSIGDGEYQLVLSGVPGLTTNTFDFFRLLGDMDGSGTVDTSDFVTLISTFLRATNDPLYLGADDFDGDHTIGTADFAQFTANFLKALPTPLPN
jgi:autotransporter-associated beta strand protein